MKALGGQIKQIKQVKHVDNIEVGGRGQPSTADDAADLLLV